MSNHILSKITILSILAISLSSCINPTQKTEPATNSNPITNPDGTTTDSDSFVRFPIEPTRQTTKYVILEDICTQFNQKFMEKIIGKNITKIEPSKISQLYNCTYYFDDKKYLMLRLEYLNSDTMKKGHESMGRTVKTENSIPMRNYVVYQENDQINEIYLILSDEKFLSFDRSTIDALSNTDMLTIAQRLANKIKDMQ